MTIKGGGGAFFCLLMPKKILGLSPKGTTPTRKLSFSVWFSFTEIGNSRD